MNMTNTQTTAVADVTLKKLRQVQFQFLSSLDAKPATKATYTEGFKNFNLWMQESGESDLTQLTLIRYKDYLLDNYKTNTVNLYLMALKQLFNYVEACGGVNIAKQIKKVKTHDTIEKGFLTPVQCALMLNSVERESLKGERDYALLALLLTCGLRVCECVNADNADLVGNKLYICGKGDFDKSDFVVVPATVVEALYCYIELKGDGDDAHAPLFQSVSNRDTGERLTTRSVSRVVKNYLSKIGLDGDEYSAHSCRHTAITLAIRGGETVESVQRMARHASVNTTMHYYHILDDELNTCSNTVASMIF